jgi:hypothetical protein
MTNSSSRFRTSAHSSSSSSSSSTGGNSNVSGGSVAKHSSIREDEGETLDLAFGTVNAAVTHTSSANNSQLPFYSGYRAHTMALSEAEEDGKGHSSQVTAAPSYLIPGSGPKMSTNLDHSVNTKPLSKLLDMDALYATVTDNVRFMTLTALVVTFFAIHNYLQELIMSFDGFDVSKQDTPIASSIVFSSIYLYVLLFRWAYFSGIWRCWALRFALTLSVCTQKKMLSQGKSRSVHMACFVFALQ